MLHQESLEGVGAIIQAHTAELDKSVGSAVHAREQLADANVGVKKAEAAVRVAEEELDSAKYRVTSWKSEKQRAERDIEGAAHNIAVAIASDERIEPVTRTLFSLVYADRPLAWQENPDMFRLTAERGSVALATIVERLQPEEPFLYIASAITAHVATKDSLVAIPPTVKNTHGGSYTTLNGGSISIVMPDALQARVTEQYLVSIACEPQEITLLDRNSENNIGRLEVAASNDQWLVIGAEAIKEKLAQLNPMSKFMALTALAAVGVEVPASVSHDVRDASIEQIVSLIAFLAAGTGNETRTRTVSTRHGVPRRVTEDTPLTRMAKNVNVQSIRYMAMTLGLSKVELQAQVENVLESRISAGSTPLNQLSKDIQSRSNLGQILDTIFH